VIAFATAITSTTVYAEIALPGIERAAESDSVILTRSGYDSIQQPYNEMMDEAASLPGLEALVLLHQDLELLDDSLPRRVREVFADPRVGLTGPLGGCISKPHCWLWPDVAYGTVDPQAGRGPVVGSEEVDAVDGALLVLAPWAVRGLRFGEGLSELFHGYDVDIGLRVGVRGGKVICHDLPCHHRREIKDDYEGQQLAGIALARMWDPTLRPEAWIPAFQS
jgi:hypothetical protein